MWARRLLACLLVLVLTGCSVADLPLGRELESEEPARSQSPPEAPDLTGPTGPEEDEPPSLDPAAVRLLPQSGARLVFHSGDGSVHESYLRDGDRLVAAVDGEVRATWFITPDGIWRRDPLGTELLRYLPPEPRDGMAWVQGDSDDPVWFLLQKRSECGVLHNSHIPTCWDLTVLNRLTRTVYRFAEHAGILLLETEDLRDTELHQEELRQVQSSTEDWETLLPQADQLPAGPLPEVKKVSAVAFREAMAAAMTEAVRQSGRPYLEIDLDGDGQLERIEGIIGEWNSEPLYLFRSDGRRLPYGFHNFFERGWQHRLRIVNLPDLDRPTLIYEYGIPDEWHRIAPKWFHGHLVPALGWHPKIEEAYGATVHVTPEGALTITNNPTEMGGFTWTRRFRIEPPPESAFMYLARLEEESLEAGPHPEDHRTLLTAAFVSHWFSLPDEMARFIPDPSVRTAFAQEPIRKPLYLPPQPELGQVTFQAYQGIEWPEVEPAPLSADGTTPFLIRIGEYEGFTYYAGTVRFGTAADGRPIILDLAVTKTDFVY